MVNTAWMAAGSVDLPVDVLDSGTLAEPMLFILEERLRLQRAGLELAPILAGMCAMRDRVVGYFIRERSSLSALRMAFGGVDTVRGTGRGGAPTDG